MLQKEKDGARPVAQLASSLKPVRTPFWTLEGTAPPGEPQRHHSADIPPRSPESTESLFGPVPHLGEISDSLSSPPTRV